MSVTFYIFTLAFIINNQLGRWFISFTEIEDPNYTCYTIKNDTWACISRYELNDYDPEDSY